MIPQISFLLNKSLEALGSSNLDAANLYLKQVIRLQSANPHALRLLGVIAAQRKQYPEALAYLNSSLKSLKTNPLTLSNIGNVFFDLKEYNNALEAYDKAIKLNPNYDEAWSNKGNVLYELKRYDEALVHHEKALSLNPNYVAAWSNKGNTLHELKRYDEAIAHYDKALMLQPDCAESCSNKGNTLNELKRYDEALVLLDKALSIKPDNLGAWLNKGNALGGLKHYDEAVIHFNKVLSLDPNHSVAWRNKGNALNEINQYIEAIACFEKAFELNPDCYWLLGDLIHSKMKICAWQDLEENLSTLSRRVDSLEKITSPFPLIALVDDAMLHRKSSEIYSQSRFPSNKILGNISKRPVQEKIRLGYFSADFKNHPVSYLTAELFELHDKNQFEIIAFSFGINDGGDMRLRLIQAFNQFFDVSAMSDLEIAKLSRDLHIDIAIDLGGYTTDSRTAIFAYRAAPIQISYIGYLGTMGAGYYDYLLADKTIIPESLQAFYSERIVYLPSYQVNDRKRIISDMAIKRRDLGLPENGFVFCCFNNNYKILPETFDGWMRILSAVEGSVLFLYADKKEAKDNLQKEAEARGIHSSRLVFGERLPTEEYLARYRACDLFLDTTPYNAGTTASDALWVGLPVLTMIGESFAGRVAASILHAIELPELVTSSQADYESLAIELATNSLMLDSIKQKLMSNRLTTPLFDTPLFTRNLESAYIEMNQRNHADLQIAAISIS